MYLNYTIHMNPFLDKIDSLIHTPLPNNCDMPSDSIMFIYLNHHLFQMMELQRQAMDTWGERSCLESRFIRICLDKRCMEMCTEKNIPNCVHVHLPHVPKAGFGESSHQDVYNYMTWLKHEFTFAALLHTKEVFFFDVDVALFRNPWTEIHIGRSDTTGEDILNVTYDIRYQREMGKKQRGCGGTVNSGVMYFLNSSTLHTDYIPYMMKEKEKIVLNSAGRLDQDFMHDHVWRSRATLKHCTLPANKFVGHCEFGRDSFRPTIAKDMITYHTNCAGSHEKFPLLKNIVEHATRDGGI